MSEYQYYDFQATESITLSRRRKEAERTAANSQYQSDLKFTINKRAFSWNS